MKQTLLIPLVLAFTTACGQSSNNSTLFHNVYHNAMAVIKPASKLLNKNLHSVELMVKTEAFAFTYNGKQISSNDLNEKEQFWQAAMDDLYEAGGPGIPTCPNTLMPVVEVQVNNTASNHDDYGSTTSYTACKARIINYSNVNGNHNYPGGVPVELRNPPGISQNLIFSSTGGSSIGAASVFTTLPEDGSWLPFYIKGKSTNTVDKSSIIEVATSWSTCDEVVVARKALMIGTSTIEAGVPQLEIEVGSISTLDDYVTWSPKICRIRWSNALQNPTLQDSTLITY